MIIKDIKSYERKDDDTYKVKYRDGSVEIIESDEEELEDSLRKQAVEIVHEKKNLHNAMMNSLKSFGFGFGSICLFSYIGMFYGVDSLLNLVSAEVLSFGSLIYSVYNFVLCAEESRKSKLSPRPYFSSIYNSLSDTKKYELYLKNKDVIDEYFALENEYNLKDDSLDIDEIRTFNGIQGLSLKEFKKKSSKIKGVNLNGK